MILFQIRSWLVTSRAFLRYFAYRLGFCSPPAFRVRLAELVEVFSRFYRLRTRLRIIEKEYCPKSGPAVVALNHIKSDDPFLGFPSIYYGSKGAVEPWFMMRDDFFKGKKKHKLYDFDELLNMMASIQINRENVTLAQLKPFLNLLREGGVFAMYTGRTRSKSGMVFEYSDAVTEPGSVAFFIAQIQRSRPEPPIPATPLTRTWNPVTLKSTFAFGPPLYLKPGATREEQRAFDDDLTMAVAEGIELNAAQLTAGLLYLRCLHGKQGPWPFEACAAGVREVLGRCPSRRVYPDTTNDCEGEIRRTLKHFEKHGLLTWDTREIAPVPDKILAAPPVDLDYRERNPVKFVLNQVIHYADVIAALEDVVLRP